MTGVRETKQAWRRVIVEMSSLVTREDRREADAALCHQLERLLPEPRQGYLLGYAPMLDEPEITPFLRHWLEMGGRLALPVWMGVSDILLRDVGNLEKDLRPGRASILEPKESLPEIAPDDVDVALIPGRFFSESCQRLGRGAGCYDALVRGGGMYRMGISYDFQVFPRIPADPGDEDMDAVVTPARIILNKRVGLPGRKFSL